MSISSHVWQTVKLINAALLGNVHRQRSESLLKVRHLLSRVLQVRLEGLHFLAAPLVLLVYHSFVSFNCFLVGSQVVVHQLQLVEVLLTADELVERILVAVAFFFYSYLLMLLDIVFGVF